MSASDWMQGPYVYALYDRYGFSIHDIGILFITGFGSSMLFGTFIGSLSDKFGRRFMCLAYALLYIVSCFTKHFNSFYILIFGRLTGGIATSILFSSFESWMVAEHFKRGYDEQWLSYTFYIQSFGNSIVAIMSGLVASYVTQLFDAMTAPFDTAIVLLFIGGIVIFLTWGENYGNSSVEWRQIFIEALHVLKSDLKVSCLGISQSMFESAMYIFVFMWTPVLVNSIKDMSHGLVFACFMLAVMIGSSLFSLLTNNYLKKEKLLLYTFLVAACTFLAPIWMPNNGLFVLISFLVYEICVGIFWPCLGTLKAMYIPENVRSTIMNYFRVPTNLFVILILNRVSEMSWSLVFSICIMLNGLSLLSQFYFLRMLENKEKVGQEESSTSV